MYPVRGRGRRAAHFPTLQPRAITPLWPSARERSSRQLRRPRRSSPCRRDDVFRPAIERSGFVCPSGTWIAFRDNPDLRNRAKGDRNWLDRGRSGLRLLCNQEQGRALFSQPPSEDPAEKPPPVSSGPSFCAASGLIHGREETAANCSPGDFRPRGGQQQKLVMPAAACPPSDRIDQAIGDLGDLDAATLIWVVV